MQEKLKKYRYLVNKTQSQMAKTWGISTSFYKKIECGIKNPSFKSLKKFKEHFPEADIIKIFFEQ